MGTVLDVGGGYGRFITAILQAHPGVRGILTELDRAVAGARDRLAASGVADRCDVVASDFFADPLPPGADAYLLAHVIHNWGVEAALPDDDSPHPAKDTDIRMLTLLPGGERTGSQYAELLTEAGFRTESATGLTGGASVMVAVPASACRVPGPADSGRQLPLMSVSPRRSRRSRPAPPFPLARPETVEEWPDGDWVVRRMAGASAQKAYRCPGCDQEIYPGVAHVVVWQEHTGADDRRHWHTVCWEKRMQRRRR